MDTKQPEGFEAWAVVELMGHRRLAGFVTEQEVFGAGLLRIDVPGEGDAVTTVYEAADDAQSVLRCWAVDHETEGIDDERADV